MLDFKRFGAASVTPRGMYKMLRFDSGLKAFDSVVGFWEMQGSLTRFVSGS